MNNQVPKPIFELKEIQVLCKNCDHNIPMVGSDQMYQDTVAGTQAREYTCDDCGASVMVVLQFEV